MFMCVCLHACVCMLVEVVVWNWKGGCSGEGGGGGWGGLVGVARDLRLSWPGNHIFLPDKGIIYRNYLTGSHLYRHQQPTHPFLNFLY